MRFRFKTKKLAALYEEEKGATKYPAQVIASFFEVMAIIASAKSTQDLRNLKSLRFEHLKGKRKGQCSLRLNDQFRLIVVIEHLEGEEILVVEITDYH